MLIAPLFVQAAPILLTGTPADDSRRPNTPVSPRFGTLINFDGLPSCQVFPPDGSCTNLSGSTFSGVTISSPDGLYAIPFSAQTAPNELYDAGVNGVANITLTSTFGVTAFGVGISDSDVDDNLDPLNIILQALDSTGNAFGQAFTVTVPETGGNPGQGYFILSDTTADIYGLQITQSVANANFSGLAIDDVQFAPEPSTFLMLITGAGIAGAFRMRKRSSTTR